MIGRSVLAVILALPAAAALAQTAQPAPEQPPQTQAPQPQAAQAPAPASGTKAGLTLAEFQARREKALMAADTDGDGKISLAEWTAFQAKRQAKSTTTKSDPAKSFARLDSNHDGFIDKAELDAFFAKRFARLDANKDGNLTRDELPGRKSAAKPAQ